LFELKEEDEEEITRNDHLLHNLTGKHTHTYISESKDSETLCDNN
jgi:hypothetical protein